MALSFTFRCNGKTYFTHAITKIGTYKRVYFKFFNKTLIIIFQRTMLFTQAFELFVKHPDRCYSITHSVTLLHLLAVPFLP